MNSFFISGMFRSGTTTIARALNAHPRIACASDPMAELFKSFRSEVAYNLGQNVPVLSPLSDYYYDKAGYELFNELMEAASLDTEFLCWSHGELIEKLQKRAESYCGKLLPYLRSVSGPTYRDYFESIRSAIYKAYGAAETELVGFKEVWCSEFIPTLAREYPQMKFVLIIRDPRAVCASKKMQDEQYPWTFLARQWRKLAALHYMLSRDDRFSDRVLGIQQEDFVLYPERTMSQINEFLDVDWHPNVADPSKYEDGDGNPWSQNSSYGVGGQKIDKQAIERWRGVLTAREVALIEYICGPEMSLFNYERVSDQQALEEPSLIVCPPMVSSHSVAKWMEGVVSNEESEIAAQIAVDTLRHKIIGMPSRLRGNIPSEVVNSAFLSEKLLHGLWG